MAEGGGLRDAPPTCADDDGDLALVIQLLGLWRAGQGHAVTYKAARETGEEGHVGRGLFPVFIFGVAVGEIDADADDFFGVGDRDIIGKPGAVTRRYYVGIT